jgi:hypothetical protein
MKKASLALLLVPLIVFAVFSCPEHAVGASSALSGSTTGWQDESVNQALAEEFAKCAAFSEVAAECRKKGAGAQGEKNAAQYEDAGKRFYRGGYLLAGQEFTRKRIRFHETVMRRNSGGGCEEFAKLAQQHDKRCENTFKRLPRSLQ